MSRRRKATVRDTETEEELTLLETASLVKKENKQIDFKEKFDPTIAEDWAQIIKDIIAMANSGGGVILFGVNDDGDPIDDFNNDTILKIDPAVIADKIYSYTNEHFSEVKILESTRKAKPVPVFLVESAATPIVFTKPGADVTEKGKQRPAFTRGSVYFRHGAKSEPGNTNDIKHALDRAINKTRKSWFEGVRKISNIKEGDEVIVKRGKMDSEAKKVQQVPARIVSDPRAVSFRPDNAAELWPNRSKELVKKVNEGLTDGRKISNHDMLCIKKQHGIDEKTKPEFVYKPYKDLSPRYSDGFVEWILDQIKRNPIFFDEARTYYKDLKAKT